jgi:hypothetical protein
LTLYLDPLLPPAVALFGQNFLNHGPDTL